MDVRGILGIDADVRNGFNSIELEVDLDGDASKADLDALSAASNEALGSLRHSHFTNTGSRAAKVERTHPEHH